MLNMGRRDRLFDPKDAEKGVKPAFPSGIGAPGAAPAPVGRSNAPGPLTRDAATAAAAAAPAPAPAPPVSQSRRRRRAARDPGRRSTPRVHRSRHARQQALRRAEDQAQGCRDLGLRCPGRRGRGRGHGEQQGDADREARHAQGPRRHRHCRDLRRVLRRAHRAHEADRARHGRVSGKIRYGKLIVAEGGELSGDVQRLDANAQASPARPGKHEAFALAPETVS